MKAHSYLLAGVLALATLCHGQEEAPSNPSNPSQPNNQSEDDKDNDREVRNGFWEANLDGGNYLVALGRISSVSRHKYVLDGSLIVDEVTIDTEGQALARFYFITPVQLGGTGAAASEAVERVAGLVDGAVRRAGTDIQDMVIKKYPLTTHAKTIEFRLLSEAQLSGLYKSAKTAWMNGKGRVFTSR